MSGPVLIFIAALLWGLDGILRRSLYTLPPITIVFLEHLIGAIILLPFFIKLFKKETLTKKEWWTLGVIALLSGVLGTLFFTTALAKVNFIPFSVVFLLQKLQPVCAVGAAAIVLKERPGKRYWVWALLAIIAAYFVTFPGGEVNFAAGSGALAAALFAVLAAVCWGSSTAFSRYALLNHSGTFITSIRFLLTTLIAIPFLYALQGVDAIHSVSTPQLGGLMGITLSSGMVALWIYYRGLKHTPAFVATIVELAFPMTAVFIDYFLYDTTLAVSQYIAAVVLLYAVYRVGKTSASIPAHQ